VSCTASPRMHGSFSTARIDESSRLQAYWERHPDESLLVNRSVSHLAVMSRPSSRDLQQRDAADRRGIRSGNAQESTVHRSVIARRVRIVMRGDHPNRSLEG
jgi:hypothetical protein